MNKEQIEKLIDDANLSSTASFRIREWFEQNPIKPMTVGLSDEQVSSLAFKLHGNLSYDGRVEVVEKYIKTQTFAQPQQFQPNWDDAPAIAEEVCITVHWADKDSNIIKSKILIQEQRPTSSDVEVGQVWNHKETGNEYMVDEVIVLEGKTKIGEWTDDLTLVVYNPSNVKGGCKSKDIYRRPIEDFLAKFKQVQL
jgi:hypothetical protein